MAYRLTEEIPQRPRLRRQYLRELGMTDSGVRIFELILRLTVHGPDHARSVPLSVNRIASESGLNRRTVINHMNRLREADLIETRQDDEWFRHRESHVGLSSRLVVKVRSSERSGKATTSSRRISSGLHRLDCFDGLPRISAGSVQLLLTDLPTSATSNDWDVPLDLNLFWREVRRVLSPNGAAVIFAHFPYDKVLAMSNMRALKEEYIWHKEPANFLNARYQALRAHETILVFSDATPLYNPQITNGHRPYRTNRKAVRTGNYGGTSRNTATVSNGTRYPTSILEFRRDRDNPHSTGKPQSVIEFLIRTFSNPGDLICDPCAGSGGVLAVARKLKRRAVGFERDERIYRDAVLRLRTAEVDVPFRL